MRSVVENQIRSTLSEPPGLAGENDERRRIYIASLRMYEELLSSARDVDYLTRPLPLFYALSQAGRAIVAAYGVEPHTRGHGLTEDAIRQPITTTTIAPQKSGLFGAAAAALEWPRLTSPVELGAVWSALPDLADTPAKGGAWRTALFVWPEEPDPPSFRFDYSSAMIPIAGGYGPAARVFEFLDAYPHARFINRTQLPGLPSDAVVQKPTPRGDGVLVRFVAADGRGIAIRDAVPEHRYSGEYWLVPTVGAGDYLPPLLLWWVLLFGLSILARYEPATWRAALDVETPLAVPLEDLLDEAIVAVPHWLLWALTGNELRLPRPQSV